MTLGSVRLLCLHGRRTNSDIFESQLAPLKSRLPTEVRFDFIDAPIEGAPAPGIEDYFKPPYFVWHRQWAPTEVSKAHEYVKAAIAQNGPYDGVIGFSEGAALAAALLLEGAAGKGPLVEPMFGFAVFFNAVNVLSPSEELGIRMLESDVRDSVKSFEEGNIDHGCPALDCVYALCSDAIPALIAVPTLHVVGLHDVFTARSHDLIKLCKPENATVVTSKVGHELPKGRDWDVVARRVDNMIISRSFARGPAYSNLIFS
ncbi:hypothetical protein WHR41_09600 [Cladosporium halotolerans]|uniref:Serine hydrolase domain-containing protein n=1 Tax=Cladosporium halotolerans TaxID=1052096 RepID=A0AB34K944_9PEZI